MSSFSPTVIRPNMPLRKPLTSPGLLPRVVATAPPRLRGPTSNVTPVRPPATNTGDANSLIGRDNSLLMQSMPPEVTLNFCNYCNQQGSRRCLRCKTTVYCSVLCQSSDWNAHSLVCKSSVPDLVKEKPKETTASPVMGDRSSLPEPKMNQSDVSSPQKVYLRDLKMIKITQGTEIQALVVELQSPGRFFLLAQNPELLEVLHSITVELQKTYSGSPPAMAYIPSLGEVCAVQFSSDMNWYRGLVQSVAADQKTANILYIDFGNEEDVPVGSRIKLLAANIPLISPCVMECRIAGVVPFMGIWSGEGCIAVRQLVAGKTVTVTVVDTLENGRIHAVDILLSSMGDRLSTFLIDHGYAAKEEIKVKPNEQEINAIERASLENFKRVSNGKDCNSWAQPPQPLTQSLGDSFSVMVTHIESPHDIICQKVENASVIQELHVKLREHCSQASAVQNFRPAPGTVCCGRFSEDNQWYRAKVLAYSSEERVCVGYIDFGNSEEVELDRLRPLSPVLLALPMQAIPCSLAGVQPIEDSWSSECMLALQQRVSNRILRVELMGVHEGKALVALIDESSDPQANVAELLLSAGYAAPATSSNQQAEQASAAAGEAKASSVACEPLVWTSIELPCDGQMVALLASIVENPGEFYCRIYNPKDDQMLMELGADLKQHCEADAPPFKPKVGEPCCAVFPDNGAWYRAMVKELVEDKVAVHFVDYGYNIQVEMSHLRAITPRLLTLPFQAFRCWLTGVEPLDSEWSSEAVLWFQTRMDGQQLSARVMSISERGYGVQLQSNGECVKTALISEKLARVFGETQELPTATPTETHASTSSPDKDMERMVKNEHNHIHVHASNNKEDNSKDQPLEGPTAATLSAAASFPVDWKTAELPCSENFKPCIVAITSPSLFYLLTPTPSQELDKLQGVIMELAVYCDANQALCSSSPTQSRPAPGAACCARFSGDNKWYRAVVLKASDNEVSVIYADYGNCEKVPFSRVLPIPLQLLKLPFRITRCALTGKEHFPTVWPVEVLDFFRSVLSNGVLATAQSFDGSTNLLSVTLRTERGGGDVSPMILAVLQAEAKSPSGPAPTLKADLSNNSTSSAAAAPGSPQPKSFTKTHDGQEGTTTATGPAVVLTTATGPAVVLGTTPTPEPKDHVPAHSVNEDAEQKVTDQREPPCNINPKTNGPHKCDRCCLALMTKIDRLEQLVLSLIAGQTKS